MSELFRAVCGEAQMKSQVAAKSHFFYTPKNSIFVVPRPLNTFYDASGGAVDAGTPLSCQRSAKMATAYKRCGVKVNKSWKVEFNIKSITQNNTGTSI